MARKGDGDGRSWLVVMLILVMSIVVMGRW